MNNNNNQVEGGGKTPGKGAANSGSESSAWSCDSFRRRIRFRDEERDWKD